MTNDKRDKIEKLVLDFLTIVDVNAKFKNRTYYEDLFRSMNDKEFDEWASNMGNTLEDTINVHQLPWESVTLKQIRDAADFLKVPLEEYVYYKHMVKGVDIRTKYKVPVGYINMKRLQQMLSKKNQFTFDTKNVDYTTGEVKGKSKVHHISNAETYMLLLQNSKNTLKEFFGPRGSNLEQKKEMKNKIATDGWVSLKDIPSTESKNEAINTLDMYIISSGLKSDLTFKNSTDFKTPFTKEMMRKDIASRK
jgi:hypothetical protein